MTDEAIEDVMERVIEIEAAVKHGDRNIRGAPGKIPGRGKLQQRHLPLFCKILIIGCVQRLREEFEIGL